MTGFLGMRSRETRARASNGAASVYLPYWMPSGTGVFPLNKQ